MEMTGEYRIPARIDRVWDGLNDPETLRRSITGCEEIERTSDASFVAKVTAKVGPVEARFSGKVMLSDIDPPHGYTMTGEGTGGGAGVAKGTASVRLAEEAGETMLSFTVSASVGGTLAQIDSRLIDATARKMAEEFFGNFVALVSVPTPNEVVMVLVETPPDPEPEPMTIETIIAESPFSAAPESLDPPASEHPPRRGGLPPRIWVAGAVVICCFLLWYFAP